MTELSPYDQSTDESYMRKALDAASDAAKTGEVPVGAVVVSAEGVILASASNAPISAHDPSAHAEIRAMRLAGQALGNYRLNGCTLYVTLEPCTMCVGAISHARIARVVYGASDPKGGAVESGVKFFDQPTCHHRPDVTGGVRGEDAAQMLKAFFKARRG